MQLSKEQHLIISRNLEDIDCLLSGIGTLIDEDEIASGEVEKEMIRAAIERGRRLASEALGATSTLAGIEERQAELQS